MEIIPALQIPLVAFYKYTVLLFFPSSAPKSNDEGIGLNLYFGSRQNHRYLPVEIQKTGSIWRNHDTNVLPRIVTPEKTGEYLEPGMYVLFYTSEGQRPGLIDANKKL